MKGEEQRSIGIIKRGGRGMGGDGGRPGRGRRLVREKVGGGGNDHGQPQGHQPNHYHSR